MLYLVPWHGMDDPADDAKARAEADLTKAGWERELAREVGPGHVLFGRSARLIARRQDMDTALFALDDGTVAEVHLTWIMKTEPDPRWPGAVIYASLDEWRRESMLPAHADWPDEDDDA